MQMLSSDVVEFVQEQTNKKDFLGCSMSGEGSTTVALLRCGYE